MKKINGLLKFLCLSLLVSCFVQTFGLSAKASDTPTLDDIKKRGVLKVGTSADYPPFEWYVEGEDGKDELAGFEMKIAEELAKALEVELEVTDMDFDGILPALESGKIDLAMAGFTPTEARRKNCDFSEPIADYEDGFFILINKNDMDKWTDASQLDEMRLAVQKGTVEEQWLFDNHPKADIQALNKQTDSLMAIDSGRVDGVLVNSIVSEIFVQHRKELMISEIKIEGINSDAAAIGVKKGQADLLAWVNDQLTELKGSGQVDHFMSEASQLMIESGQ